MAVLLSDGEMKTRGYTETISRLITSAKMQAKMKYVLQLDCWTSSERVATCVSLLFFYLYNISFLSALFSLHSFAFYHQHQVDHHEHDMHEGMLHTNYGRYTLLYYVYRDNRCLRRRK